MGDYDNLYQAGMYLSPGQQDLLLAALSSNNPNPAAQKNSNHHTPQIKPDHSPDQSSNGGLSAPPSGGYENAQFNGLDFGENESPFLDFNPDVDFEFPGSADLIGDLPDGEYELGEKRKSMDGKSEGEEETGKKRRESEAKKPGRKPLTSEPTTKRKAQNRAAQRAFRERKEKHLKDLETKVDELQKNSDTANQENGLLRAQVERLQVELREYRKRLSWMTSGSGRSAISAIPSAHSKGAYGLQNNEFLFDFPKFGDLPGSHLFNSQGNKNDQSKARPNNTMPRAPGVLSRDSGNSPNNSNSSKANTPTTGPSSKSSPWSNGNTPSSNTSAKPSYNNLKPSNASTHDTTNSDSPSSSSDSHQSQLLSSNGTSPEPSLNSPIDAKPSESDANTCSVHGSINGEKSFCAQLGMACGNIKNPIPAAQNGKSNSISSDQPALNDDYGLDWLTQQNGGQFDPVLFGDWREPQDAVLSQDFGSFFNDAFPLPDLGSPSHNLTEATNPQQQQQQQHQQQQPPPKKDLISQIDSKLEEEVVPGEDKDQMLSCNKIWDRLQSMERFRNGEIDVDNLCSELRTKARCSEGGVVVNQSDVDDIMGRAK